MKQVLTLLSLSLRGLPSRRMSSGVVVIGVAVVVAVLIAILGIAAGLRDTVARFAGPERVIVLSEGAAQEYMGALTAADVAMLANAPGILRDARGEALVQPMGMVLLEVTRRSDGGPATVFLRGTGPKGWAMNRGTRVVEGRMYRPGLRELIVGRAAQRQYQGLELGSDVELRGVPWRVVGVFSDNGAINENGMMTDVDTLLAAFGRPAYQSIAIQLQSADRFDALSAAVDANPALHVNVKRYADYLGEQFKPLLNLIGFVAVFVGGVMALGATFGSLNAMYVAVDGRSREIATLRAIGFRRGPILISVVCEALVLALLGAALGVAAVYVVLNGRDVASQGMAFPLRLTPTLVVTGATWAVVIGMIGGFAPALRAARTPVAVAFKAG